MMRCLTNRITNPSHGEPRRIISHRTRERCIQKSLAFCVTCRAVDERQPRNIRTYGLACDRGWEHNTGSSRISSCSRRRRMKLAVVSLNFFFSLFRRHAIFRRSYKVEERPETTFNSIIRTDRRIQPLLVPCLVSSSSVETKHTKKLHRQWQQYYSVETKHNKTRGNFRYF